MNAKISRPERYPHKCLYCGATEPRLGPYHMGREFKVIVPMRGEIDFTPYTCMVCQRMMCEATGLADIYRQQGAESVPPPPPAPAEPEPWAKSTVDSLAAALVQKLELRKFDEIAAGVEHPEPPRRRGKPREAA